LQIPIFSTSELQIRWNGGIMSAGISTYQAVDFYVKGGQGLEVAGKALADIGFITIGIVGGPVGLAISIGYLVADLVTDGFGVSYNINP